MNTRTLYLCSALVFSLLISGHEVRAAELIIRDAGGVTRAAGAVSQTASVEFTVTTRQGAPAEGEEIALTNTDTGDALSTLTSGGTARFEGVAPGTWTVTSLSDQVVFNGVTVLDETAAAFGGSTGLGLGLSGTGATAAGVGAAAIGVGAAAASGGGGSSLSASN